MAINKSKYRYLICNGDANSAFNHGGLPYNLLETGKKFDFIDEGLSLGNKDLKYLKYLWNFIQILKYRKPGGWQYSQAYSKMICKQIKILRNKEIKILSIYPFLPHFPWERDWKVDFYIDATTSQIFKEYSSSNMISDSFKKKIITREKRNYINANKIICRSNWAVESLLKDYKIKKEKIFCVPGGANIDIKLIDRKKLFYIPPSISNENPIKLGFLGVDWERKGGNFLLKLANVFNDKGIPLEIRVIGPREKTIPNHPSIKYLGFINKSSNLDNFVNELKTWHFGTLFSRAEAFGISNRECLLLGVPVICHDVGGISSTLPDSDFGMIFNANPQPIIVFEWIMSNLNPYERYISLRKKLFNNYEKFTWDKAVMNLKEILD